MAHYITSANVTDDTIKSIVTDPYLTRVDQDLALCGRKNGVAESAFEIDPLDPILVDLCLAYLGKRICLDKCGINAQAYANGMDIDIYLTKLKLYKVEIDRLEGLATKEVFTGNADTGEEFAESSELYRG